MDVLRVTATREDELASSKSRILVSIQLLWMGIVLFCLQLLSAFSLESFYILSYLGLVFFAQLFAPVQGTPRWWRSAQWTIRLGFLGLCYFVGRRVVEVTQL